METIDQIVLYGASVLAGTGLAGLGFIHRGNEHFDESRGINVADGDGLASKIIKHFPTYSRISSAIDHLITSSGCTFVVGGLIGLLPASMPELNVLNNIEIIPFIMGGGIYLILHTQYEAEALKIRNYKIDFGDILQNLADITGTFGTIHLLYRNIS